MTETAKKINYNTVGYGYLVYKFEWSRVIYKGKYCFCKNKTISFKDCFVNKFIKETDL